MMMTITTTMTTIEIKPKQLNFHTCTNTKIKVYNLMSKNTTQIIKKKQQPLIYCIVWENFVVPPSNRQSNSLIPNDFMFSFLFISLFYIHFVRRVYPYRAFLFVFFFVCVPLSSIFFLFFRSSAMDIDGVEGKKVQSANRIFRIWFDFPFVIFRFFSLLFIIG